MRMPRRGLVAGLVCVAGAGVVRGQWQVQNLLPPDARGGAAWGIDSGYPVGTVDGRGVLWDGAQVVRDLTPVGTLGAVVLGGKDGVQVGDVTAPDLSFHAAMWSGSAESWVDLHPAVAGESHALAVEGGHQVGYFTRPSAHACMWSGTAASMVDLHPTSAWRSYAYGVEGGVQVGQVIDQDGIVHGAVWHGTAASVTYMGGTHTSQAGAMGIDHGNVVGFMDPNAFIWSEAEGFRWLGPGRAVAAFAGRQLGGTTVAGVLRLCIWSGTEASRELLPCPPGSFDNIEVTAIWSNGATIYVVGYGELSVTHFRVPYLWTRPLETCYANCDGSTVAPVLNVNDFLCFMGRFAAGDSWANCDGSTGEPVLTVEDFVCFQGRFAAGCR